ncbi:MAG: ElyC/SanA/YdcF family protein [Bacillota bacterium]
MVRKMVRGYDPVVAQSVDIPHDVDIAKGVAVQLGVLESCKKILPGDALSTKGEALAIREYLKDAPEADSLIIVTSKYHSGREEKIFANAMRSLDRKVEVISCPTEHDDFNADRWWRDRWDLKRGVLQYLELMNSLLGCNLGCRGGKWTS